MQLLLLCSRACSAWKQRQPRGCRVGRVGAQACWHTAVCSQVCTDFFFCQRSCRWANAPFVSAQEPEGCSMALSISMQTD